MSKIDLAKDFEDFVTHIRDGITAIEELPAEFKPRLTAAVDELKNKLGDLGPAVQAIEELLGELSPAPAAAPVEGTDAAPAPAEGETPAEQSAA